MNFQEAVKLAKETNCKIREASFLPDCYLHFDNKKLAYASGATVQYDALVMYMTQTNQNWSTVQEYDVPERLKAGMHFTYGPNGHFYLIQHHSCAFYLGGLDNDPYKLFSTPMYCHNDMIKVLQGYKAKLVR